MAAVVCTNTKIESAFAPEAVTWNAGTEATISTAQDFTITLTRADVDAVILIKNANATAEKPITYAFSTGIMGIPASVNDATVNTVASEGAVAAIKIDSAFVMKSDGTIALTITPTTGQALTTAFVAVIESAMSI